MNSTWIQAKRLIAELYSERKKQLWPWPSSFPSLQGWGSWDFMWMSCLRPDHGHSESSVIQFSKAADYSEMTVNGGKWRAAVTVTWTLLNIMFFQNPCNLSSLSCSVCCSAALLLPPFLVLRVTAWPSKCEAGATAGAKSSVLAHEEDSVLVKNSWEEQFLKGTQHICATETPLHWHHSVKKNKSWLHAPLVSPGLLEVLDEIFALCLMILPLVAEF